MNDKYKIAVFDVDGTLLDTTEGVIASVKRTIQDKGLAPLREDQLLTFIGPPIHDSFARVYGLSGAVLQELADCFRNHYKNEYLFLASPYDGIYEAMDRIAKLGVKIAIATYKRQDYAEAIMKHFKFDHYSDIIYGADFYNKLKKADIIRKCMEDLGCHDFRQAVMIGDSSHDAVGAQQMQMPFLGVTYGFDFKSQQDVMQFGAIGYAETPMDIVQFFEKE